jgi:hypothetical protein
MAVIDTLSETALRDSILSVRDVSRGFARGSGEVRVLADVDLSLYSGEMSASSVVPDLVNRPCCASSPV